VCSIIEVDLSDLNMGLGIEEVVPLSILLWSNELVEVLEVSVVYS
jgi:hypothetical protein